jgi:hypothetical protein
LVVGQRCETGPDHTEPLFDRTEAIANITVGTAILRSSGCSHVSSIASASFSHSAAIARPKLRSQFC